MLEREGRAARDMGERQKEKMKKKIIDIHTNGPVFISDT